MGHGGFTEPRSVRDMPTEIRRIAGVGILMNSGAVAVSDACCCSIPITCESLIGSPLYLTFSGVTACLCTAVGDGSYMAVTLTTTEPPNSHTLNGAHLLEYTGTSEAGVCRWEGQYAAGIAVLKFNDSSDCSDDPPLSVADSLFIAVRYFPSLNKFEITVKDDDVSFPRSAFTGTTAAGALSVANTQTSCPSTGESYISYAGTGTISF